VAENAAVKTQKRHTEKHKHIRFTNDLKLTAKDWMKTKLYFAPFENVRCRMKKSKHLWKTTS
jgi:hypothetical protein